MKKNILKKVLMTAALVTTLNFALLPVCVDFSQTAANNENKTIAQKLEKGEVVEVASLTGFIFSASTSLSTGISVMLGISICRPTITNPCEGSGVGIGTQNIPNLI